MNLQDLSQLISKQYHDEEGVPQKSATYKENEAQFQGGDSKWINYLSKNLYFPPQWQITGAEEVIVTIDFAVDEEGNVVDVWVSAPFHPDFDKIAVDLIRKSPKWKPQVSHNRKIKVYRRQPVAFAQR